MSRIRSCAPREVASPRTITSGSTRGKNRIIGRSCALSRTRRSWSGGSTERELLCTPRHDLANEDLVFVPAVDVMHGRELAEALPRLAELADDRAVQLHLEYLAGYSIDCSDILIGIRVGTVQVLMRPGSDAYGPRCTDVLVHRSQRQIVGKHLNAAIVAIANVNVSFAVRRDRVRQVHLPRLSPASSDRGRDKAADRKSTRLNSS